MAEKEDDKKKDEQEHQHQHKLSALGIVELVSGLLLVLFVVVHTIVGAVYYAWPFDAQFIWVAWLGAILLPIHIISVGIRRYKGWKRRKEWEKVPPEQRPQRGPKRDMTPEEKAVAEKRWKVMKRGFAIRWISGVIIVLLFASHLFFNNIIWVDVLLLVCFGWHVFYATGCVLRDLNANRNNRKYWRVLTVIVALVVLAFFLYAHSVV